jgi:hypothetical protein
MPRNVYGAALQNYVVLGNVVYPADANGLITNVLDGDVDQLIAQRCLDEAAWLKLQTAHPAAGTPSAGTSGQVQMANGSGAFLASQITDNGTTVKIANGQIVTATATPLSLTSDTGVTVGSVSVQGSGTFNAAGLYANNVLITANGPTGPTTPASAGAAGVAGTVVWDSGFIYVCVATNSWKRVAIAAW